jgi:hypothetical protein
LEGTAVVRDMDSGTQEVMNARRVAGELRRKLGMPALESDQKA